MYADTFLIWQKENWYWQLYSDSPYTNDLSLFRFSSFSGFRLQIAVYKKIGQNYVAHTMSVRY